MQPTWALDQGSCVADLHESREWSGSEGGTATLGCGWASCEYACGAAVVFLSGTSSQCAIPQQESSRIPKPGWATQKPSVSYVGDLPVTCEPPSPISWLMDWNTASSVHRHHGAPLRQLHISTAVTTRLCTWQAHPCRWLQVWLTHVPVWVSDERS